ncbi:MAG: Co2+/Mg2+ efflux protein ApaG [Phycisphaerales bacterium]|nr:MAG: Co2+/Mg2+ efflux protein ApaG [Phycisphaerales bacterium]
MVPVEADRSRGSEAITRGVRVSVTPSYRQDRSDPGAGRFIFSYRVRIANEGEAPVSLLARRWVIVDADGERHEVEGEGVVGLQPQIQPGAAHEYESFCPLQTAWGTMEGSYLMRTADGEEFHAEIARFYLAAPVPDEN